MLKSKNLQRCLLGAAGLLAIATVAGNAPSAFAKKPAFTLLYSFTGANDGGFPTGGLIHDKAGNLYGTTHLGGANPCDGAGCGTVFKLAPDGTETVLYSFKGGSDGAEPLDGLIKDKAGNLYGTTFGGGTGACSNAFISGCGTVFKLAPDGTETVLYSFSGGSDGSQPHDGVIRDEAGNLYGTTYYGGSTGCSGSGCGVVFMVSPGGVEKVLYTFTGGSDGGNPYAGLIQDKAGNLYGTTAWGGATNNGTVFRLAPDGTETALYSFQGGSDGGYPVAGVIADSAGNLYGTTIGGGAGGNGTVFKLAPNGTKTVLYAFTGGSDGGYPDAGVIMDKTGNLYGTTYYGGGGECYGATCGVVFKLTPNGTETVLHAFDGNDGGSPYAGLIRDANDQKADFYGTTDVGGASNSGGVFKLTK